METHGDPAAFHLHDVQQAELGDGAADLRVGNAPRRLPHFLDVDRHFSTVPATPRSGSAGCAAFRRLSSSSPSAFRFAWMSMP